MHDQTHSETLFSVLFCMLKKIPSCVYFAAFLICSSNISLRQWKHWGIFCWGCKKRDQTGKQIGEWRSSAYMNANTIEVQAVMNTIFVKMCLFNTHIIYTCMHNYKSKCFCASARLPVLVFNTMSYVLINYGQKDWSIRRYKKYREGQSRLRCLDIYYKCTTVTKMKHCLKLLTISYF